jgi:hypothetical protein
MRASLDAFRQGLRERGYVEGQNIVLEYRAADGKIERFPGLATELTRLKVILDVQRRGRGPASLGCSVLGHGPTRCVDES